MRSSLVLCAALACVGGRAVAVESCELNGQHVNPSNGNTTAGKSGLMRCRDGEGGPVVREQEPHLPRRAGRARIPRQRAGQPRRAGA